MKTENVYPIDEKNMIKKLQHRWHWYWFKLHCKWLLREQKNEVYKQLYKSIDEYLMNDIKSVCVVDTTTEELLDSLIKEVGK